MAQITLRDYLQETEDAISAGHIEDALSHCQNILAQFPESLEVQRLLGEIYLAQDRLHEAQQSFDWVLTNDPENVVTYCDRALISERMSDYDTALDCYQQAYELSRGNSDIRQEFNQLSARAGQQGFMFSRAGLARLYMRGDLLTQAIQEWEAVLAVGPERLDARTGLLETYWREGLYDRVEHLATQILQDVPGCLKAVLLLAYVTSAKNMQQAQDLLRRAEALDPDMQQAQELFADVMVSQPAEPFLKLLRKSPSIVETDPLPSTATYVPGLENVSAQHADTLSASSSSDTLSGWNGSEWAGSNNWKSDAHQEELVQEKQPEQDPSALPTWVANPAPANAAQTNDAWSVLERQQEAQSRQEMPEFAPQLTSDPRNANPRNTYGQSAQPQDAQPQDPWQSLPDLQPDATSEQKQAESSSWDSSTSYDRYKEPGFAGMDTWESTKGTDVASTSGVWASSAREEEAAAPPAWLNMLTQSEKRQASGPMPTLSPVEQTQPARQPVQAPAPSQPARKEEPQATPESAAKDEEPFSFGPEWLKSLGATTMDEAVPGEASPVLSTPPPTKPEPLSQEQYEPQQYEPQQYDAPQQESYEDWASQLAKSTVAEDKNLLTTLEELESDLRSQGFIPLQPNSLSSIAQTQESVLPAPSAVPEMPEIAAQATEAYQATYDAYKEPALSSALAELGNFIHQSSSLVSPSTQPDADSAPAQPAPQPVLPAEEPSWLASLSRSSSFASAEEPSWFASLNTVPAPSPTSPAQQEQIAQEETMEHSFSPFWAQLDVPQEPAQQHDQQQEEVPAWQNSGPAQPSWTGTEVSQELPQAEPVNNDVVADPVLNSYQNANEPHEAFAAPSSAFFARSETPSGPLLNQTTISSQPDRSQESRQTPVARNEPMMLDSELETTMKRPAVRLQPMQQRPVVQKDPVPPVNNRAQTPERAPSGRTAENNLSYQERLLQGYQHQLVGDYDEAMHEYRIIIRSAPELLADVVSNVRALLKLAPKYSVGYRVLGDVYMRQGEYLQAMEAYNKALTMAKRAKS